LCCAGREEADFIDIRSELGCASGVAVSDKKR
jgi:hypothetical protein